MDNVISTLNRLPLLSELALVILLAWMVAGWLLPQPVTQISSTIENIEKSTAVLPDLQSMLAVKLFGQPPQQAKPVVAVAPQAKPVVKRPLTLKLLGTVVAGPNSAAIIAIKAGAEQQAYFIGDTIQAGVILQSVEANAIVVNRGGSLERISLEEGGKLASSPLATTLSTMPNQQRPSRSMNKTMSRAHLQKQLNDFPALLSQARAMPHFVNGKIDGFSVTNIVPGSLYQQAGLQNGDIIVSVNGERITGAQQAMGIYTKLKSSPALDLELIRAGGLQNIHYNIH